MLAMVLLGVLLAAGQTTAATRSGPKEMVQERISTGLTILRAEDMPLEQKMSQIEELIEKFFNFQAIAQGVMGPYWRHLSAQQREEFKNLFRRLLEDTYLRRLDEYSGEKVTYDEVQQRDGRAEVHTHVVGQDLNVPVVYRLSRQADGWQVYDVIVEDVSMVRNYRTSYRDILRGGGYEALKEKMQNKITQLQQSDNGAKGETVLAQ